MNVFEQLAERQISSPRKARIRAAEKRALRKVADEQRQLSKAYRKWRAEKREKLLTGPFGSDAQMVVNFLEEMTLESGDDLITLIEAGPWRQANADTRFEVLHLVHSAITKLRERNGRPALDDSLPWSDEPPTAFEIIHEVLS
jgi:hypothetical protein